MSRQFTCAGWLLPGLVAALLAGAVAIPVAERNSCDIVVCSKDCSVDSSSDYQPQRCSNCCPAEGTGAGNHNGDSMSNRLARMESAVSELRVMTGLLLALVLLLVLSVVVLFLQLNKKLPRKFKLPAFLRFKKDTTINEKTPQKHCNGVAGNSTGVSRLANHQSNSSPHTRRASLPSSTLGNTDLEPQPRPFRVRQPSESTCPEEGDYISPQGYDNLALSTSTIDTSTLHNTSNSSTDTLGPALSTNTLHTTLPSESPLDSNIQNNTRV